MIKTNQDKAKEQIRVQLALVQNLYKFKDADMLSILKDLTSSIEQKQTQSKEHENQLAFYVG